MKRWMFATLAAGGAIPAMNAARARLDAFFAGTRNRRAETMPS
jgi:hypothetical protein